MSCSKKSGGTFSYSFAVEGDPTSFLGCVERSSQEQYCPGNYYWVTGFLGCIPCPAGNYSTGSEQNVTACRACREDYYIDDQLGCTPCPHTLHTTRGVTVAVSRDQCICPVHMLSESNNTICSTCPPGYMCNTSSPVTDIRPCRRGNYCENGALESPANPGTYIPNEATPPYGWTPCPNGTLCDSFENTFPPPCPSTWWCDGRYQYQCPPGFDCEVSQNHAHCVPEKDMY